MQDRDKFPPISEELVQALDETFIDECPALALPDREVWYRAGQASVVKWLKAQCVRQRKNGNILRGGISSNVLP